jgi:hypothetical protein
MIRGLQEQNAEFAAQLALLPLTDVVTYVNPFVASTGGQTSTIYIFNGIVNIPLLATLPAGNALATGDTIGTLPAAFWPPVDINHNGALIDATSSPAPTLAPIPFRISSTTGTITYQGGAVGGAAFARDLHFTITYPQT